MTGQPVLSPAIADSALTENQGAKAHFQIQKGSVHKMKVTTLLLVVALCVALTASMAGAFSLAPGASLTMGVANPPGVPNTIGQINAIARGAATRPGGGWLLPHIQLPSALAVTLAKGPAGPQVLNTHLKYTKPVFYSNVLVQKGCAWVQDAKRVKYVGIGSVAGGPRTNLFKLD